jgi:hypothetical protein
MHLPTTGSVAADSQATWPPAPVRVPDWQPPWRQLVGYGIQVGAVERQALKEVVKCVAQALLQSLPLLRGPGSGGGGGRRGRRGGSAGSWGM